MRALNFANAFLSFSLIKNIKTSLELDKFQDEKSQTKIVDFHNELINKFKPETLETLLSIDYIELASFDILEDSDYPGSVCNKKRNNEKTGF